MDETRRTSGLCGWDVPAAAGMAALALFYAWIQPWLPDPVPTHFDALGHANGWTSKGHLPWVVFGLPLAFWLVLWSIGWVSARTTRDPARDASPAFVPLRGFMGLGTALLMGGCLAVPFAGTPAIHAGAAGFFVCLALGIFFMARALKRIMAGPGRVGALPVRELLRQSRRSQALGAEADRRGLDAELRSSRRLVGHAPAAPSRRGPGRDVERHAAVRGRLRPGEVAR